MSWWRPCMTSGAMKLLEIAPGRWAHPSGALWLSEARTALLADVHLGYGWALRRRGQLGPVHEAAVRRKLLATIADLRPQTIVFVGDVVHAPRPGPQERAEIEATLGELAVHSELVLIPGNHDRGFHTDYPGAAIRLGSEWRESGLLALHGHILPKTTDHLIVGHIHPALGVVDHAGATQKLPVFVASDRVTVLPAFSPLSAGGDIRTHMPAALGEMLDANTRVIAASGKRVVDLGPLTRLSRLPSAW
jgi:putative SbcD/Mre11-related phosphoesterase